MENRPLETLFREIIITDSSRVIQSVFVSSRKLKYDPPYQREYVWHEVKATNFMETILWHGEIPPIVLYKRGDELMEVIDGRQRCETIDKFLQDAFSLQAHGLDKLWYLAGKKFSQLDEKLQNRILQAKLRCIIIQPQNDNRLSLAEEDSIKRAIFKRYNMGISALKKEEVYMAQYLDDPITLRLKKRYKNDSKFRDQLKNVFAHKSRNTETLMQHIRHLLTIADIPINKYVVERDDITNKYYDYYAYHIAGQGEEKTEQLLQDFSKKLALLAAIQKIINEKSPWLTEVLVAYDCVYWAMGVCGKEGISPEEFHTTTFRQRLASHIAGNAQVYANQLSNYRHNTVHRYHQMARFFSSQFPVSFNAYLKADADYALTFRRQMNQYMDERFGEKVKQEHFTQTVPTMFTINDILYEIKQKQFCIKPAYQRQETMTVTKASALIESILLHIKLLPIYVYVREDGVREVIDGQQRLLAIIGFMGASYTDENNKNIRKHKFRLCIEKPVLQHINNKKYNQLPETLQNRILDFELNIIEIRAADNPGFKPEELYKRLNHKPFPIREHTFEYWNAYIDQELTGAVKEMSAANKWLYIRKEDNRMLNLQMITALCYLELMLGGGPLSLERVKEVLHFYDNKGFTVIRIKRKANITATLESPEYKSAFLLSLNQLEYNFIEKVNLLTENPRGKTTDQFRNKRLDAIIQTGGVRMSMRFFILWLLLSGISIEQLVAARSEILAKIDKVFSVLKVMGALERLEQTLAATWDHYNPPLADAV